MTMHTYKPQPMSSVNFLHLMVSEIKLIQDFGGQGHYAKIKGQIKVTHDVADLLPQTNVPTKYQLPTPYNFQDIAQKRCSNSRSLWEGQRSNQGQTMTLHSSPPNQCPYQVSTSYTLQFLRYSMDKFFSCCPHDCLPAQTPARPSGHHG